MFALWISVPDLFPEFIFSFTNWSSQAFDTWHCLCAISPRVSDPSEEEEAALMGTQRNRNCGFCSYPAASWSFGMVSELQLLSQKGVWGSTYPCTHTVTCAEKNVLFWRWRHGRAIAPFVARFNQPHNSKSVPHPECGLVWFKIPLSLSISKISFF